MERKKCTCHEEGWSNITFRIANNYTKEVINDKIYHYWDIHIQTKFFRQKYVVPLLIDKVTFDFENPKLNGEVKSKIGSNMVSYRLKRKGS